MTIHFDRVSYRYPGTLVGVEDIELDIAQGELLAIVGPSGSGKSTCLKLVAGFFTPDAGTISINGVAMGQTPPEKRQLGIVFQSYALFPHMTVGDNVAYPLKVRGTTKADRRRAASEMLERVGLDGFADRSPASLSGGQQQRVALARALVFKPHALLLDEPLSALDAGLRVAMRDEIRRVQRDAGIATLHVTHDQEEALSMADRLIVMRDGRIEQVGKPMEVYDRPATRFVASFLGHANFLDGFVCSREHVQTNVGPLRCQIDAALPIGARVTAMVRPEQINVVLSDLAGIRHANYLTGAVGNDRFLGAVRRFDFHVAGEVLCVETQYRTEPSALAIPPEAIRLLPCENLAIETNAELENAS